MRDKQDWSTYTCTFLHGIYFLQNQVCRKIRLFYRYPFFKRLLAGYWFSWQLTGYSIALNSLRKTGTLPSAALGIGHSEKKKSAKPSLPSVINRALGKAFAECRPDTRQRKVAVNHDGCFAECLKDDTRQRIYIIFSRNCLPSVGSRQRTFLFFLKSLFAECLW